MEPTTYRPHVSRETRLLLKAAVVAVVVLWLLARVRFRDRPVPPSPIPAVLSQLAPSPRFGDLAVDVAALAARLAPSLIAVDPHRVRIDAAPDGARIAALRLRDDIAVAWVPPSARNASAAVAIDRAGGLAVFRVPSSSPTVPPTAWVPRVARGPRSLVASDVVATAVAVRPAFMASFEPITTPLWSEPLWAVPAGSDVSAGSILFTSDAETVGLVIPVGGGRAIVPTRTLVAEAERLLAVPQTPAGALGIEVQALTPALASATGSAAGVMVSWVEPAGAARGLLAVGDVIEAVDGRTLAGRAEWDVVAARLSVGTTLTLRVRRHGTGQELAVVAAAATPPITDVLGLALRPRPRTGAEVVSVVAGSAGERAGLAAGDVVTLAGSVTAPTPRQVTRAFAALRPGDRALVGVSRGTVRFVTTLERAR